MNHYAEGVLGVSGVHKATLASWGGSRGSGGIGRQLVFNAQSTISVISGHNTVQLTTSQKSFHSSKYLAVFV